MSGRLVSRILSGAGRFRSEHALMSTLPSARPPADDISKSGSARFDAIIGANPVQLVKLPTVNRALLASTEIKQGALIFSEAPILCARAPRHKGKVYLPSSPLPP